MPPSAGRSAPATPMSAPLRAAVAGALSLVFPTWCAGCDRPDETLCDGCRAELAPTVTVRRLGALDVHSGIAFTGVPARVLRAGKEEGRTTLLRALAPALAAAARDALESAPPEAIAIVPVPTSAAAMRRRGYRVVELIAGRAGLPPQRLLRTAGRPADQRGLGLHERDRNVAGTMRARGVAGRAVLLVDDVVTTGATLREAARALAAGGARVVGAATVASTPRTAIVTATET